MSAIEFPFHYETTAVLSASIDVAFDHLDDFHKLSAHMEQPSKMMMGSSMRIETDEREGRAVGAIIGMRGSVLGVRLALREVVTERLPPRRKVWKTLDTNLLVIGAYSLGFELSGGGGATTLRVFIDYELPKAGAAAWLGRLFGGAYAKWCANTMAADARRHFAASALAAR
jgi:hypothetical protein